MFSDENLKNKSASELKKMLEDIEEELEELEVERKLTLGGTGQHIGVGEVERIRNQLDRDRQKAIENQTVISRILKDKTNLQ
jgi:hypothetical protein